jgi:apolipoprotein N-acyltransferase
MAHSKTLVARRRQRTRPCGPDDAEKRIAGIEPAAPSGPYHSTLAPAVLGSLLLFLAFPPAGLWPLAWLAPVAWVHLIRREELPGKRPYRSLWLAGACFWLSVLYWLCLPYPPVSWIGWLALSGYLACYLPAFVGLSRVAVHRLRCPVVVAAPVVWTALEFAQAHFLTGFSMAALGNSQYRWIGLIQIADLTGAYGVSFVVLFAAACIARACPCGRRGWTAWPIGPLALVVATVLAYGHWQLARAETRQGPKLALIQGSIESELKHDPKRQDLIGRQYLDLSLAAVEAHSDLDLIIWPETMYRDTLFTCSDDVRPPPEWPGTPNEFKAELARTRSHIGETAILLGVPLLLGIDTVHFGHDTFDRHNSALYVERGGRLGPRYDKMHLVMFGEYVPLAKRFPWLYQLTPLGGGLEPGKLVPTFVAGNAKLAATICYETALAHVVRQQVDRLRRQGDEPDVLVNLTNDGWFRGSSELDLHLVCGVFRAVECRKPLVVAANTGFSAWVDADGRIVDRGPRRDTAVLVADVQLDGRGSAYVRYGDLFPGACLLGTIVCGVIALPGRIRKRSKESGVGSGEGGFE